MDYILNKYLLNTWINNLVTFLSSYTRKWHLFSIDEISGCQISATPPTLTAHHPNQDNFSPRTALDFLMAGALAGGHPSIRDPAVWPAVPRSMSARGTRQPESGVPPVSLQDASPATRSRWHTSCAMSSDYAHPAHPNHPALASCPQLTPASHPEEACLGYWIQHDIQFRIFDNLIQPSGWKEKARGEKEKENEEMKTGHWFQRE